jgi:hypothetical protein
MDWSDKAKVAEYNRAYRAANREKLRAYEKVRSALPKNVAARAAYQKSKPPAVVRLRQLHSTRYPTQRRAVWTLNNAIADGRAVRPSTCSRCGKEGRIEGHHNDYSKPLDVIWLCRRCHVEEHARKALENDREVRSDLSGSSVEIRNMEQSDSSGARPNGALYHHDA